LILGCQCWCPLFTKCYLPRREIKHWSWGYCVWFILPVLLPSSCPYSIQRSILLKQWIIVYLPSGFLPIILPKAVFVPYCRLSSARDDECNFTNHSGDTQLCRPIIFFRTKYVSSWLCRVNLQNITRKWYP
jgi:hypothetical protein